MLGRDHDLIVSSDSDAPICEVLPRDAAENDNATPDDLSQQISRLC